MELERYFSYKSKIQGRAIFFRDSLTGILMVNLKFSLLENDDDSVVVTWTANISPEPRQEGTFVSSGTFSFNISSLSVSNILDFIEFLKSNVEVKDLQGNTIAQPSTLVTIV